MSAEARIRPRLRLSARHSAQDRQLGAAAVSDRQCRRRKTDELPRNVCSVGGWNDVLHVLVGLLPAKITFGISDMFSFFQFDSKDSNGVYSPSGISILGQTLRRNSSGAPTIWLLLAARRRIRQKDLQLHATHSCRTVGALRSHGHASSGYTGALKLWMNGQVIFDLVNVKTRFPDVGVGGCMYTEHNATAPA